MSPAVLQRIRGHLDDLQPVRRRIAAVILEDPAGAGAMTIDQLTIADCLLIAVSAALPGGGAEALARTRAALGSRRRS